MMAFIPTLLATVVGNFVNGTLQPDYTPAQVLFVDKTGSDTVSNGLGVHGSEINPFLTINKAQSVLQPSGEIHVKAGRYFESTVGNPFVPQQVILFPIYAATAPLINGTDAHPCVLRAAEGHEGLVIIDGGGGYTGIFAAKKSNWVISGIRVENCMNGGIVSSGGATLTPNLNDISSNWTVENCCITAIDSYDTGGNVSGISPWGTKDWVIRDCLIYDIRRHDSVGPPEPNRVAGIQTYCAINLHIENCYIHDADYGFFAKDHWLEDDLVTPYQGATIRKCHFKTRSVPVQFNTRGGNTAHMGDTLIDNSILHHTGVEDGNAALFCQMSAGLEQSTQLRIENCVLRAPLTSTAGLFVGGVGDVRKINCIDIGGALQLMVLDQGEPTLLTQCDHNAYTVFNGARMNTYGAADVTLNFAAWKIRAAGNPSTLGVGNPDANSFIAAAADMFVNVDSDDYRFKTGSPTIGTGIGGVNMGPYQTNLEHIGLTSEYSAGE